MDIIVGPLLTVVIYALQIYVFFVIAQAVLSWLIAFNVVNTHNRIVYSIGDFLYRVTEPALRPIRRVLPDLGPVDISPILLLLGLWFLQDVITRLAIKMM